MEIKVTIGREFGLLGRGLADLAARSRKAMAEGLNEGGDKVRTQVRRDLKEQMNVKKYGAITSRTPSHKAGPGNLRYEIHGEGKGLPIDEFPVSSAVHRPVTARPWGVSHTFKRSFKTSARGLLRARLSSKRFPIRSLRGPAVSKEIVKDKTAAHFEAEAADTVERAVVKRLGRLMG
jgi:hypothetical protein